MPQSDVRVLAVVVTHNRRELLARCVEALQAQSRTPDEIVVINNGSTDGTEAMLQERAVRCVTQENLGSAGGWHTGIQLALDEGFDAIWLMDDDGYPDSRALERLTLGIRAGFACLSSVVLREDDRTHFVFPFPALDDAGLPAIFRWQRKIPTLRELAALSKDGTYAFAHFFNGALISAEAVRRVGNVDPGFFIFGDEVDYFFRLRAYGPVHSVLDAHHFHPDVSTRPYTPVKVYYYVKNTLVLNRRYFDWVALRNILAVCAALGRTFSRNGPAEAFSYLFGKNASIFYRAIVLGLRGRVGKDFIG
jgi:rhamnopyranosyl-N-acetylglucosaminyl-diphospho-decaprenol beta-1,3/1,4-galactofuranosyltransferase